MKTINGIGTTIYGRARRVELTGQERFEAEAAGYIPCTYQVVKWFVILLLPVIPLGNYRVIRAKQRFWNVQPAYYRMTPQPWDWFQILRHYILGYALLIFTVGGIIGAVMTLSYCLTGQW